jgi:hypothetical protein
MKKLILLFAVIFFMADAFSQNKNDELPKMKGDTLYTSCGYKIIYGRDIKIGVGSMPDGDFKFIRRYTNQIFANQLAVENQAIINQSNALPRSYSGYKYVVKKIESRGDEKRGYVYYLKISMGLMAYEIDVENAIASGEISVPDEYKANKEKVVIVKQQFSVGDELTKLKKLLDDGALTKPEFDLLKKKILDSI